MMLFFVFNFANGIAQNAADVDTSFGEIPGFNSIIYAMAKQPDGKILVGGNFTKYKGKVCNYFVRLLANGDVDPNFILETSFWYKVNSIAIQPDGKILVGGGYSTLVAGLKDGVIRLNSDGSTDYTFSTISEFSGITGVNTILIQTDGKIILTGSFSTYNSISRKYIVRINSDGSLDSTFDPGTGFNNLVTDVALQTDGKIMAVGNFDNYNGYTRNRIIRLNSDGSVDLTFSIGVGFGTGTPNAVIIQPDGKIVIAGNFSTYKNVTQNNIVRLSTTGDVDTSLNIGTGFSYEGYFVTINDIAMDSAGNFIIGGAFSKYNNISKTNCVKIGPTGLLDNSFTIIGAPRINVLLLQNDQKVILTSSTPSNSSYIYNYISRFNANSSVDYTFDYGSGFNNPYGYSSTVSAIQPDGKIIVGGNFSLYKLHTELGLIRLNADGTKDPAFNVSYLDYCQISKLLLQPNGKIIALGTFRYAGSTGGYFTFIRFNTNGSQDMTFSPSFYGSEITLQADGKILVCNGNQIKRLNSNGTIDATFNIGTGFSGNVRYAAIQPDGKIIAVGDFTLFNGEQYQRIVRLLSNGSVDTTFNVGEGFNNSTWTVSFQPDGKILVGGDFGSYNLISSWGIVRINTDGSCDTSFNSGFNINTVNSIVVQSDGKIIAGGYRSYFVNDYLKNLVRFNPDGSVDTTFDIGTGFDMGNNNSYISKLNLQSDGKILISGSFENYKSVGSSTLIRLNGGDSTLSNQNFTTDKLVLYPNPTHDYIHLNIPGNLDDFDYEIADLAGKKLIGNKNAKNTAIDVQALSSGIYVIKVKAQDKEYVTKFAKD